MSRKSEPMFVGEYGIVCIHSINEIAYVKLIILLFDVMLYVKGIKIYGCYI